MTSRRNLARDVEVRAAGRCEYCRMHQSLQGATFHIEHIVPRSRGGLTQFDNLAWACPSCNLRKSNRIAITDPDTGTPAPLFNPRADAWETHFQWNGYRVVGSYPDRQSDHVHP